MAARQRIVLTTLLDTDVLIRHLTGDPPRTAKRATRFLASASELVLMDLVVAECVQVLKVFYEVERDRIAAMMRAAVTMPSVRAPNADIILRALELYESEPIDFADAYLVATAELTGLVAVASFDKTIDRVGFIERVAP